MTAYRRFIGAPIEVEFDRSPLLAKKPGCPDRFIWDGNEYEVVEKQAEWHDYGRRGRMARNMRPQNLARAARRGSWGVGRDYYRVRTAGDRVFELYYDRAPKDADDRHGRWILSRELIEKEPPARS